MPNDGRSRPIESFEHRQTEIRLLPFMAGAGKLRSRHGPALLDLTHFRRQRIIMHGMYVQDDWKANQKLTLNLGFRYEIQMPADRAA